MSLCTFSSHLVLNISFYFCTKQDLKPAVLQGHVKRSLAFLKKVLLRLPAPSILAPAAIPLEEEPAAATPELPPEEAAADPDELAISRLFWSPFFMTDANFGFSWSNVISADFQ